MRIVEFSLHNVKGIKDIVVPVSSVVIVSGKNGSGKTSIVEGLTVMFDGGHNPDIVGPYDDKAVQTIKFDNGDVYTRTTTAKGYRLEGVRGDGTPIKEPATTLKALVSGLSLTPTGLVDAAPKDRLKFLQSAMPCTFAVDEIKAELGEDAKIITEWPSAALDIQAFRAFTKLQYERRTNINRSVSELEGTRSTLLKSLPPDEDIDWSGRVKELRNLLAQANADATKSTQAAAAIRDEEIDRLRKEAAAKIEAIHRELEAAIDAVHKETAAAIQEHAAPYRVEVGRLTAEIAAADEKAKAIERAKGTRESIETIGKQAREKANVAAKLDRVLENLGKLERRKLEDLPIQDVDVRDGKIFYQGKNYDTQLNTAQQHLLSFEVAALTLGDLKFMLFDRAESLDPENREEFIEGVKTAGFQVVMAERTTGPLQIEQVA